MWRDAGVVNERRFVSETATALDDVMRIGVTARANITTTSITTIGRSSSASCAIRRAMGALNSQRSFSLEERKRTLSAVRRPEEEDQAAEATKNVRVDRALAALKFELDRGCVNTRGKTRLFSDFAKAELSTIGEELKASARRTMWNERCRSAFERYDELNPIDREYVINAAREVLEMSDAEEKSPTGKQSLIEGDAWNNALQQGQVRRLEVEAVMRNGSSEQQGSGAWFQIRASRLTASAFGNAIGFWAGGRNELWEEKLGLREGFSGNEATEWGSSKEDEAVRVYESLTRKKASHLLFQLLSNDDAELWIGASPDGLIGTTAADIDGEAGGVLEIKCPFNRGSPQTAKPYDKVPWYYIPQVQGLMAIFNRPWCDLVSYTVNGGVAIYRVERDHEYWALLYSCMSDFWWQNVIPAKHALASGKYHEKYRPSSESDLCAELKNRSKQISSKSQTTWIPPEKVAQLRDM